ncbi:biotin-dependent carboxyltransferase family protein [Motilimonas sp. 1_MG-2023]|uniref:5-oxoprolinase subunit C family protein n=1 Tax=Motilimonas sp. 1_MG-2023 TaxID=3062672 RepID=UPI0026E1C8D5|nr:biotin-dependent carboxyltransferase family protein [Motilimonas sp. 1_MG-2023]MDO6526295.1 biotin-dependent carboxyltransferase family protein [Motilimonas sp. 1_MG-2023]
MSFKVINGGLLSTLQDLGRLGHSHTGFSQGGSLDLKAACWANYLLGNSMDCAVIEITLGQLSLQAQQSTVFAVCGANMQMRINERPLQPWRSAVIKAGETLSFGHCRQGMRCYLSVSGGFKLPLQLGSVATVSRDQLGGLNAGAKLQTGDVLPFSPVNINKQHELNQQCVPATYYQHGYQSTHHSWVNLNVFKGPQWHLFSAKDQQAFLQQHFVLDQQSNRMAAKFSGEPLRSNIKGIVSQGINLGAIQVPPNGLPVALLNDRQTLGGYAKIANLTSQACWQLAQLPPGCHVQFTLADLANEQASLRQFYRFFGINL